VLIDLVCPVGADVEPLELQPASATAATKTIISVRIAMPSIDGFATSICCRS
jgi:hypothetical protein